MAARRGYGSGSLREKRPGVWEVRYAGRARTIKASRKEAERALAGMVAGSAGRRPQQLGVTLGRLLDEWLPAARIEASTRATYEAALAHLPATMRKAKLDTLDLRTFDRLYADLERAGVSVHQIRKLHTALSAALTAAVRWQYLAAHPARGAQLPKLPHRQVTAPGTDVVVRLLDAAAGDLQATIWLRLALATGARRGEVLALRWPAVDLDRGTVRFVASMNEDRTVKATKTDRERTITLDPGTVDALRSWRALQVSRALELGVKAPRSCFVLSNALDGSIPWRPDGASQRFRRLRERAGVGDIRLHDLRHTNATLMLRNGVDPMTAAYRLGHSRPTTTMNVYGHVVDGADRAAADTIGRLLG
jgi:integrase